MSGYQGTWEKDQNGERLSVVMGVLEGDEMFWYSVVYITAQFCEYTKSQRCANYFLVNWSESNVGMGIFLFFTWDELCDDDNNIVVP